MLQINDKAYCCGCMACAQVCPRHCIQMQPDDEGFWYPTIDQQQCVQCGLCRKVCPILNKETRENQTQPTAYAVQSLEDDVRLGSSSGGVFTMLARKILRQQGVVYGAAMPSVGKVAHIRVSREEELHLLRGSKYVQSDIGSTYLLAREDLRCGRPVLFTGTPCQIEGLLGFLGKDDPNLICMDFICHGVPSPMVWNRYVRFREDRAKSRAVRVSFRNKQYGWKEFSMVIEYENGKRYTSSFFDDLFMQVFLRDLCLRPSCYQCHFKTCSRRSDITVADFWGISEVCPHMDDDKGTSLVMVHSQKGEHILDALLADMKFCQVDFSSAIAANPSMTSSAVKPETRDAFLAAVREENFREAVGRYVKRRPTLKHRIKTILRRFLRH